ncbi:ATP-dependent rRNA helicase SPB4 [Kwoniella heveanensis BCC8398]|uniref:ATP-dependent RNA helicase n=1 Tax=Kwoniella heveanensis BCC8398 TaxID=1296120 RepID=A0A1B9GUL5_9TREE|nr:ATP-dependent rRNA helicase SPB4 [Kwoniella heveanensis BCC8398]
MDRPVGAAPAFGAKWTSLNPPLTPWIMDVINKMGFVNMTPVQSGTIPRAIKNQDCVVEAVTGSGKTLSFVIPVLERICRNERKYRKGEVAAVVIAPTRELATQIHDVFHHFLSSLIPEPEAGEDQAGGSSSRSPSPRPAEPAPYALPMLVTSGTPTPYETFLSLQSNILIGTPGRLASFLLSPRGLSVVRVSELDVLVLDEADRLLSSPDHRRDVERIMRHLPKQRRTHLFSATMTDAVEEMIGLGLRNPVRIVVNLKDKKKGEEAKERRTPTGLQNAYLVCRHAEKTLQLVRILQAEVQKHESAKFIVYFSTCAAVDYFYRILSRMPALSKYHLTSLHGDLPPRIRETALNNFTSHPSSHLKPAVLLCTDVAARGVDFPDIDVVVQYDAPTDPKSFSHRAGRTARAGRRGKAVVLLDPGREVDYVEFLNVRKIPLVEQKYLGSDLEGAELPLTVDEDALSLLGQIRKIVLTDRELADKGAKAFVSSLQAYRKHEASFIFRLADLDFHAIATSYGLLRMPAMPEIKEWRKKREVQLKRREKMLAEGKEVGEEKVVLDWQDEEVDWDAFAYASKSREASRQANLLKRAAHSSANGNSMNGAGLTESEIAAKKAKRRIKAEMKEAWSEQKERKNRKEERREKVDRRKQAQWEQAQAQAALTGDGDNNGFSALTPPMPRASGKKRSGKNGVGEGDGSDSELEDMGVEYKALKKEMKEERASKKSKRDNEVATGSMFDDLE